MALGVMWTACSDDCPGDGQTEMFELPPLPVKEGEEFHPKHWELPREGGVVTPEGGDARTTAAQELCPVAPPPDFLRSLWEGGDHGAR